MQGLRGIGWLAMLGLVNLMSACTIARPVELPATANLAADEPVYVALSDAVYKKDLFSRVRFWRQTFSVVNTLEDQAGFLAFSARIELLGNRASTMTVWRDRASMRTFAYGDGLHREVVAQDTTLLDSVFYGGEFKANELPSWETALELLREEGRHYYE
ncbi:MAG: hypothetical protein AAF993_11045 [Pseudomonadota bacterium]